MSQIKNKSMESTLRAPCFIIRLANPTSSKYRGPLNNNKERSIMAKRKQKEDTLEDIIDRIDEDLTKLRNKVWEMEADDQVDDDDFEDEEDED